MDPQIKKLIFDVVIYGLGYMFVRILGKQIKPLLDKVSSHIDNNPPSHITLDDWRKILTPGNEQAGIWLGEFERLFFYIIFITQAWILIGFWLTFKVASKWETWQNIVKVPDDSIDESRLDVLDRRNWGDRVLQRFLLGTLGNAFAGFFGYLIVHVLNILKVLLPCA